MRTLATASLTLAALTFGHPVEASPVTFWASDRVGPGDVVLLYGGGLKEADHVLVWRQPDEKTAAPGSELPAVPANASKAAAVQPTDGSMKFVIPDGVRPGVYGAQVVVGKDRGAVRVLNRPEVWFLQPTALRPGLAANQAPPGAEVQIVGKDFQVKGSAARPRLVLRAKAGGALTDLPVSKVEPFALTADLPAKLEAGAYELFVHNGRGGNAAWSAPLAVEVKAAAAWPDKVFNVRDFGAKGDDATDDTKAVRDALAAADKNGGGVVLFPWGTYRFTDWILVPEKTVLRGADRDATVLKWPLDAPKDEKDYLKAAVLIGPRCGLDNLTVTGRRVETLILDVQAEFNNAKLVPPDALARIRPWGQGGDIFLRRLLVQHQHLASRPEQQKPVTENPALNKKYWEGVRNVFLHDGRNCEVSDCAFEGGDQLFTNLVNGRIVRNSFANHMGYSWTALGGGAIDVVCEGNDIKASSSWGWGWTGMQRVYSAHNTTHNFVRGEREAMTLDISSLPTARPAAQYWGTPVEVGGGKDKPFLRFPAADKASPDGYRTGWTPGCFKGGTVFVRAFQGGAGGGQARTIVDNTADTVFLDKPFATPPETTLRPMYVEVAPRHARAHVGTTCWLGTLAESAPAAFAAKGASWVPQEFVGMTALVLDGKGAGQYRVITSNTADRATLDRPWDVVPDATSTVGVWSLMRHMIVYDTRCTDASAFAQLYGAFYDYTVEGCRADRTQGLWGQMGWFVQFRDNLIQYAHAYHPGIGMRGPNPEKNTPFGYTGLDTHRLRITKTAALQYPDHKLNTPFFADEALGRPVPTVLGHIQRGNVLRYNQRLVVQPWTGDAPPAARAGGDLFRDVIIDGNTVEHGAVGVMVGPNAGGVVLSRNTFRDVAKPVWLAAPAKAVTLAAADEGERLFASGDLTGWVEEQHSFFKKAHPDAAKTWTLKDGVVSCDGSLGNCGFLRYDRKLTDFTLRLEYRMPKGCNSGVCVRVPAPYNGLPDETLPSKTGYEVQIQDDAGTPASLTSSGALYNAVAPEINAARPAGEWNELEVICRGPRLRVTLNGRVVQDVDQTEVAAIRDRKRTGYLMLQNHGHAVEFRNIRLKDESAGR
jgi:hypothetical protein